MLFPLIMLTTELFETVNLIYTFVTDYEPFWLDLISNIFSNFYGIANAIVF